MGRFKTPLTDVAINFFLTILMKLEEAINNKTNETLNVWTKNTNSCFVNDFHPCWSQTTWRRGPCERALVDVKCSNARWIHSVIHYITNLMTGGNSGTRTRAFHEPQKENSTHSNASSFGTLVCSSPPSLDTCQVDFDQRSRGKVSRSAHCRIYICTHS